MRAEYDQVSEEALFEKSAAKTSLNPQPGFSGASGPKINGSGSV